MDPSIRGKQHPRPNELVLWRTVPAHDREQLDGTSSGPPRLVERRRERIAGDLSDKTEHACHGIFMRGARAIRALVLWSSGTSTGRERRSPRSCYFVLRARQNKLDCALSWSCSNSNEISIETGKANAARAKWKPHGQRGPLDGSHDGNARERRFARQRPPSREQGLADRTCKALAMTETPS